jgi:hypothetical protein
VRSHGNDDEGVWRAFIDHEGGLSRAAVRAKVGVGEIRTIKHHVRRERCDRALLFVDGHDVETDICSLL